MYISWRAQRSEYENMNRTETKNSKAGGEYYSCDHGCSVLEDCGFHGWSCVIPSRPYRMTNSSNTIISWICSDEMDTFMRSAAHRSPEAPFDYGTLLDIQILLDRENSDDVK